MEQSIFIIQKSSIKWNDKQQENVKLRLSTKILLIFHEIMLL
jgi:hypothetical protein